MDKEILSYTSNPLGEIAKFLTLEVSESFFVSKQDLTEVSYFKAFSASKFFNEYGLRMM